MFAQMLTNHWAACTDNCFCDRNIHQSVDLDSTERHVPASYLPSRHPPKQPAIHRMAPNSQMFFFWTAESTQSKNLRQYFAYNIDFYFNIFMKLKHWIILAALLR